MNERVTPSFYVMTIQHNSSIQWPCLQYNWTNIYFKNTECTLT